MLQVVHRRYGSGDKSLVPHFCCFASVLFSWSSQLGQGNDLNVGDNQGDMSSLVRREIRRRCTHKSAIWRYVPGARRVRGKVVLPCLLTHVRLFCFGVCRYKRLRGGNACFFLPSLVFLFLALPCATFVRNPYLHTSTEHMRTSSRIFTVGAVVCVRWKCLPREWHGWTVCKYVCAEYGLLERTFLNPTSIVQ